MAAPISPNSQPPYTGIEEILPHTEYNAIVQEEEVLSLPSASDTARAADLKLYAGRMQVQTDASSAHLLWDRVHQGIQQMHGEARSNQFLLHLIQGKMDCSKAYVVYLCNLYWLHKALEEAQEDLLLWFGEGCFVFPELFRSAKLLKDIKLWSMFNDTACHFADKETASGEFSLMIQKFVQPCAREFALRLKEGARKDPAIAFGAMYALYGTIMSGGQAVKRGVKLSFLERLQLHLEAYLEEKAAAKSTPLKDDQPVDEEFSKARIDLIEAVLIDAGLKEVKAEESVALFTFDAKDFSIPVFKQKWHGSLNDLPGKLGLKNEAKELFEKRLIEESGKGIRIVLETIASLLDNLRLGVI